MRAYDRTVSETDKLEKQLKKFLEQLKFNNDVFFGLQEGDGPIFRPPSYEHPIMQEEMLNAFNRYENYPTKNRFAPFLAEKEVTDEPYNAFPEVEAWTDEQYQLLAQEQRNKYLANKQRQEKEWAKSDAERANTKLELLRTFYAPRGEITPADKDWKEFLQNYRGK